MPSNTEKPYWKLLLTKCSLASAQSTMRPSIQMLLPCSIVSPFAIVPSAPRRSLLDRRHFQVVQHGLERRAHGLEIPCRHVMDRPYVLGGNRRQDPIEKCPAVRGDRHLDRAPVAASGGARYQAVALHPIHSSAECGGLDERQFSDFRDARRTAARERDQHPIHARRLLEWFECFGKA